MRAREKITVFWLEPSLESWTLKGERRLCSEAKNKHFWNQRGEKKRKSYFWQWRSKGEWLSEHFQGLGRLSTANHQKKKKKSISSVGTNWKGQDLQRRTAVLSTVLELRLYTVLIVSRSHGWLCLTVTSLLSSVPSFIGLLQASTIKRHVVHPALPDGVFYKNEKVRTRLWFFSCWRHVQGGTDASRGDISGGRRFLSWLQILLPSHLSWVIAPWDTADTEAGVGLHAQLTCHTQHIVISQHDPHFLAQLIPGASDLQPEHR